MPSSLWILGYKVRLNRYTTVEWSPQDGLFAYSSSRTTCNINAATVRNALGSLLDVTGPTNEALVEYLTLKTDGNETLTVACSTEGVWAAMGSQLKTLMAFDSEKVIGALLQVLRD